MFRVSRKIYYAEECRMMFTTCACTPTTASDTSRPAWRIENIKVFKAAKLVNFMYMKQNMYTLDDIGELKVFPFVTDDVVETLMIERDEYRFAATNVDPGYDLLKLWQENKIRLTTWYNVAMDLALMQPSLCFIERDFSMLRACDRSDRIAAAVILKYNRGRVSK